MRTYIHNYEPLPEHKHTILSIQNRHSNMFTGYIMTYYMYTYHTFFCCQCIHVHLAWKSWHTCIHDYIEQRNHCTSSAWYILFWHDKQYLVCNVWYPIHKWLLTRENASEKMHSASYSGSHYNAHRHMDSPLCTYFCTGTRTVYIRTQVFLHADLSIVGRIRTSGHPGLSRTWGLAAWQRLHKSQHHHLRCTGGYYPTLQNGTPGQKRNRVKQWDLREDESTWPMFGKVQQVMFGGLRLTQ